MSGRDRIWVSLLVLLAILSALPFFYAADGRMAEAHDLYVHSMRMIQFDETLRSGVWYPRWLGGMNNGYGAATTLFYPPLFYYATSAAHAILDDWPESIQAVVMLMSAGSAAAFYLYARQLGGPLAATAGTAIYILLPYRLIDLYHRGAFPELISFMWMPLAMCCLSGTSKMTLPRIVAGGVAFALLVITHPPVAYLFALSLALFVVVRASQRRSWTPVAITAAVCVIGILLSAFYLVPALLESSYAKENVTQSFPYDTGYVTNLLAGTRFQRMIAVTILATTILFVFYSAISLVWTRGSAFAARPHLMPWVAVGALAVLMMTPLSIPLVRVLPGIEAVAFPWRWLAILGMASASIAVVAMERLLSGLRAAERKSACTRMLYAAAFLTVGIVLFGALSGGLASNLRRPFVPPGTFLEDDFTPRGTPASSELPREAHVAAISGLAENSVRVVHWEPNERIIEASLVFPDTVHVSTFMFPGWQGLIGERQAQLRTHESLGTMLIDLPAGNHTIRLFFGNTETRKRSEQASVAVLGLCLLALVITNRRVRSRFSRIRRGSNDK